MAHKTPVKQSVFWPFLHLRCTNATKIHTSFCRQNESETTLSPRRWSIYIAVFTLYPRSWPFPLVHVLNHLEPGGALLFCLLHIDRHGIIFKITGQGPIISKLPKVEGPSFRQIIIIHVALSLNTWSNHPTHQIHTQSRKYLEQTHMYVQTLKKDSIHLQDIMASSFWVKGKIWKCMKFHLLSLHGEPRAAQQLCNSRGACRTPAKLMRIKRQVLTVWDFSLTILERICSNFYEIYQNIKDTKGLEK